MADETELAVPENEQKEVPGSKWTGLRKRIFQTALLMSLAVGGIAVGLVVSPLDSEGIGNLLSLDSGSAKGETADEEGDGNSSAEFSYLNMDEMIVNISGHTAAGRKTSRFLKLKVSIVLNDGSLADAEMKKPFLRDGFQNYLRQLDERELEGSLGMEMLRAELLKRAKAIVGNDAPQEILIGELIIQ